MVLMLQELLVVMEECPKRMKIQNSISIEELRLK